MLERADTAEAIGLNRPGSALLDQSSYRHILRRRSIRGTCRCGRTVEQGVELGKLCCRFRITGRFNIVQPGLRPQIKVFDANQIMTNQTKRLLKAVLSADGEVAPDEILRAIAVLQGNGQEPTTEERPALLTQAGKARQLGVSRFTIRKMVQCGRLHPVELLPGLVRYRADEALET